MTSNRDEDILDALVQHIKYERENDVAVLRVSPFKQSMTKEELEAESTNTIAGAYSGIPMYARGMNVFDINLHLVSNIIDELSGVIKTFFCFS